MNWILLEEQKPAGSRLVIIATNHGVGCGKYRPLDEDFDHISIQGNLQYGDYEITHWMPLPESPEK